MTKGMELALNDSKLETHLKVNITRAKSMDKADTAGSLVNITMANGWMATKTEMVSGKAS